MSRLAMLVIVGALVAPLTGVLAADMPGDFPPSLFERQRSQFFDLDGWYPRADNDLGDRGINLGDVEGRVGVSRHTAFKNVAARKVRVGLQWNLNVLPLVGQ